MSWLAVEKALVKSLSGLGLGYPIVQENDSIDRLEAAQSSALWLEIADLPAISDPLSKDGLQQYNGLFQISVYGQQNIGKSNILQVVDEILPNYVTGQTYSSDNCDIEIDSSYPTPATIDGSWYKIVLTINWFAYISL